MKISLFYKNVTVLDYAFLDDHLGVVGDSLHVNVDFIGHTDEEGVVYDFSYAKKKVKEIIDRECDHRLVVPRGLVKNIDSNNISLKYTYGLFDDELVYECPSEGVCELPFAHVNKVTIAAHLEELILKEMPDTVKAIKLELVEEKLPENKATFHYTHGLKDHYGNCQRLFHGHRNTVDIIINGETQEEWELNMAKEIFKGNIHFCLWDNVVNKDQILAHTSGENPVGRVPEADFVEIEYESSQGRFYGKIPARTVYFMEDETTVENLSMHFANIVKAVVDKEDTVTVRAYEGIAKGSISTI